MEIKEMLERYPFLQYRNIFTNEPTYKTEEENIKHNYYTEWDGYGWEKLWKKYLEKLFYLYDNKWSEEVKKRFRFTEIKEKYGTLRIYTSLTDTEESLEMKAEMLSAWTCERCGKEPRDSRGRRLIWRSSGWIGNYCKECFKKEFGNDKEYLNNCRHVKKSLFSVRHFESGKQSIILYKEKDGWLEKERTETIWSD